MESKLNGNFGRYNIDDRGNDEVATALPLPKTGTNDPSARVTVFPDLEGKYVEKTLGLPVIWSLAPESITHCVDEEDTHATGLPVCTKVAEEDG